MRVYHEGKDLHLRGLQPSEPKECDCLVKLSFLSATSSAPIAVFTGEISPSSKSGSTCMWLMMKRQCARGTQSLPHRSFQRRCRLPRTGTSRVRISASTRSSSGSFAAGTSAAHLANSSHTPAADCGTESQERAKEGSSDGTPTTLSSCAGEAWVSIRLSDLKRSGRR